MNELVYHSIIAPVGVTYGEGMLIADENTTIDEIIAFVFTNDVFWFFDGISYHIVVAFEDFPDGIDIMYFDNKGNLITHRFGGVEIGD